MKPIDANNLFIHVGLMKTGTTFLNRSVFPKHSQITHLGKPYGMDDPMRQVTDLIIDSPYGLFDTGECIRLASKKAVPALKPGGAVTWCESRLASGEGADRYLIAERLASVFGNSRVFITLRRQQDLIEAMYYQALGKGKTRLSYPRWANEFNYHRRDPNFSPLNYWTLVDSLARVYGRENVTVFLYEEFSADALEFAKSVAVLLGVDAGEMQQLLQQPRKNARMTAVHAAAKRIGILSGSNGKFREWLPKPVITPLRRVAGLSGRARRKLPESLSHELVREILESNRRLASDYDLPLERHGYSL